MHCGGRQCWVGAVLPAWGKAFVAGGKSPFLWLKGLNQPSLSKVEMEKNKTKHARCSVEEGGCELLFPQGFGHGCRAVLSPLAQRKVAGAWSCPTC